MLSYRVCGEEEETTRSSKQDIRKLVWYNTDCDGKVWSSGIVSLAYPASRPSMSGMALADTLFFYVILKCSGHGCFGVTVHPRWRGN